MGWTPHVHTEFHEHRVTLEHLDRDHQRLQDCHPLWSNFPDGSPSVQLVMSTSKPQAEAWFRLFRVRSPLLTESRLLSFPPVTEMFQLTGFARTPYAFRCT